jgi:hypothetical protein
MQYNEDFLLQSKIEAVEENADCKVVATCKNWQQALQLAITHSATLIILNWQTHAHFKMALCSYHSANPCIKIVVAFDFLQPDLLHTLQLHNIFCTLHSELIDGNIFNSSIGTNTLLQFHLRSLN